MIQLQQVDGGVLLPVRAHASARRSELRGEQGGCLRVAATQAPEKGRANKAICILVARALGLRKSQVHVTAGATSSTKKLLIQGIEASQLQLQLAEAIRYPRRPSSST